MLKKTIALLVVWCLSGAASAIPITITGYDVLDVAASGMGGWSHTYTGLQTPTGSTTFGGSTVLNQTGGSGTMNDGVIGNSRDSTVLFTDIDDAGAPLSPQITLFLSAPAFIDSIQIFGGPSGNLVPGLINGVTVTTTGPPVAIALAGFGVIGGSGVPINDLASLTGTGLELVATTSITLSNFTGPLFQSLGQGFFSITEIALDGRLGSTVPTPTTLALFGMGIAGLAFARRKKA